MPPLCGLHFAALGLCCTWYEQAPIRVLVIFAALTLCARSATNKCVSFDTLTLHYVLAAPDACFTTTLWIFEYRNDTYLLAVLGTSLRHNESCACFTDAWFQVSPRECTFVTLNQSINELRTHHSRFGPMMVRCTDETKCLVVRYTRSF